MSFDIGDAAAFLHRTEEREADIHPEPARLLLATLDRSDRNLAAGSPLPLLWHWLYFPPTIRQSALGEDGHTRDSGLLPDISFLPRRMWAGSRLRCDAPLRVGDTISRHSEVVSLTPKVGNSGRLLFVGLRHRLRGTSGGQIVEEQDIVLREPSRGAARPPKVAEPRAADFERSVTPTPTLLFRFSALTFNAHRIHYDYPYATQIEGYEGLVVHGPLMAVLMLDLIDRHQPDVQIQSFAFKALNPAFAPSLLSVKAKAIEGGFDLWIESSGLVASTGSVRTGV